MERRTFLTATAGLVGVGTIGSLAFSSTAVSREVSVNVVADDNAQAALGLQPGPAGGTEIDSSQGQILITGEADGTNVISDSEFVFGDPADPVNVHAFRMVNNLAETREYAVTTDTTSDGASAIDMEFYDNAGNLLGSSGDIETVSEEVTDVSVETDASVPADTSIELTVYEDTDPDSSTDDPLTAVRMVDDGVNTYDLTELDFSTESDVWIEVEFTVGDSATADPELYEVTLQTSTGTVLSDSTNAGQVVSLAPGETAYAVMYVTTPESSGTMTGQVEISASGSESFG